MGMETALPKNIRQIGDIRGSEKICLEDYVMTYIRKKEKQEAQGYLGIFLGEKKEAEDAVYTYIRGIYEIQEESTVGSVMEECGKYFPDWEVQGCCVIGAYPASRMEKLAEEMPESRQLLYHLQDQEETLYWMREGQYTRVKGYFVFYEQNRKMQEYLTEIFRDDTVEKESLPDKAIKSFREKIKEKSIQKNNSMLKLASSFFVVTVLVIGAIAVNRVEDIRAVQNASNQIEDQVEGEADRLVNGALIQESEDSVQQTMSEGVLAGPQSFWEDSSAENASVTGTIGENADTIGAIAQSASAADVIAENSETAGSIAESINAAASASDTDTAGLTAASASDTDTADLTAASASDINTAGSTAASASDINTADSTAASASDTDAASSAAASASDIYTASVSQTDVSAAQSQDTTTQEEAVQAASIRQTQAAYTIREGDTLADICSRYYGGLDRLTELCEANGITDANLIMPGQKIVLP